MSITGGMKFFDRSRCLFADGASISAAVSGDASAQRAIDKNPVTYWRSVGSTDLVVEEIEIVFSEAKAIDRLLLVDHNWKQFTAQYFTGGSYTDFAAVVGIDGSKASISETAFADDTAYYEFTEVTTTKIKLTITKTQTADQEKYINQIIATKELGTLQGFPNISQVEYDRNIRKKEMLSGKSLINKSEESSKINIRFKDYPPSLSADIDLMFSLHDRDTNFLIWVCGGRRGSTYFKKQLRGYRLRDVVEMQVAAPIKPMYSDNIFANQINFEVKMEEVVS